MYNISSILDEERLWTLLGLLHTKAHCWTPISPCRRHHAPTSVSCPVLFFGIYCDLCRRRSRRQLTGDCASAPPLPHCNCVRERDETIILPNIAPKMRRHMFTKSQSQFPPPSVLLIIIMVMVMAEDFSSAQSVCRVRTIVNKVVGIYCFPSAIPLPISFHTEQ